MISKLGSQFAIVTCSIAALLSIDLTEAAESNRVRFVTSCEPNVQSDFDRAVTLLHSFEYLESTRIFNEIIDQDSQCAMAYWGLAMSIWHPLWSPPSAGDLEKAAGLLVVTESMQVTPRESTYINAIKAFFSSIDISTHGDRARMYAMQMRELYKNNLDDPEAAVFYALALLAIADPSDESYANSYKAAALLNWVMSSQPSHPGALHYLIHSYDKPGLAHLGLTVAGHYADAAPDSAHAQHMPSHIFTRLGLWERSLSSNIDSTRSAAEYTVRAGLSGHYDDGLHGMDYLVYAMLQSARDEEASETLHTLLNIGKTNTENFKVAYAYAASPARYALERRQWQEASDLQLQPAEFHWEDFGSAQSIHHFARGIGAARSGQPEKAMREIAIIRQLQNELPSTTSSYFKEEAQVHIDLVTAWIRLTEGNVDEAIRLASQAADREDAVDKDPVTPGEVLPARELFAEMLYEIGENERSLEQYKMVLTTYPNRLNALLGAARAADRLGDIQLVDAFHGVVREQTESGNHRRESLMAAWESITQ